MVLIGGILLAIGWAAYLIGCWVIRNRNEDFAIGLFVGVQLVVLGFIGYAMFEWAGDKTPDALIEIIMGVGLYLISIRWRRISQQSGQ